MALQSFLRPLCVALLFFTNCSIVAFSAPSPAQQQQQQECTGPLQALIPCLGYVQGQTPTPSQDCCPKLLTVHQKNEKCLCVLIQASTQGSIPGIKQINSTLALNLPVACNVPADPKRCPALLGIAASSPEAQIFETPSGATPKAGNASKTPPLSGGGNDSKNTSTSSVPSKASKAITRWFAAILGATAVIAISCPL